MIDQAPDSASRDDDLILALAASVAERDRALGLLFERYAARFSAYLARRGVASADLEDLVQDIFLRLLQRAPGFKAQGQGRAWIWRVAHSTWVDAVKKQRPTEMALPLAALDESTVGVCDYFGSRIDFQQCVQAQLGRFVRDYPEAGQVVLWAAVDGLATSELGELIGRSVGATREFLSQSRKRLWRYLEACRESE